MAQYPTAVATFTSKNPGDKIPSADWNSITGEITAIETGLLNGTARLNSSGSTLASLSVTGGSTLTSLQVNGNSSFASSTIAIGGVPYQFPTSAPGSSGQVLTVATAGSTSTPNVLKWGAGATSQVVLLKANSGTDSNAAATNVDTFAITGLTAKDQLLVNVTCKSVTQATNGVALYNNTDGVVIVAPLSIGGGSPGINEYAIANNTIMQAQAGATSVVGLTTGVASVVGVLTKANTATFTTNYTGTWTLALRHGGVTAGGTLQWAWALYKLAGQ